MITNVRQNGRRFEPSQSIFGQNQRRRQLSGLAATVDELEAIGEGLAAEGVDAVQLANKLFAFSQADREVILAAFIFDGGSELTAASAVDILSKPAKSNTKTALIVAGVAGAGVLLLLYARR
jgi:hypothetical protein